MTSAKTNSDDTLSTYEDVVDIKPLPSIQPSAVLLNGCSIVDEADPATMLYELDHTVTSVTKDVSSIAFHKTAHSQAEKATLFYLVHPINARFRSDTPAYFLTCEATDQVGNMRFEVSKSKLTKPSFKALVSPQRNASSKPSFDEDDSCSILFSARFRVLGSKYVWTNSDGKEIAIESTKGAHHRLAVTVPLSQAQRDALVAMWCLRLWHDTNETWRARFEALEELSGPEAYQPHGYGLNKMNRRTAGLTGFVAALGGG